MTDISADFNKNGELSVFYAYLFREKSHKEGRKDFDS